MPSDTLEVRWFFDGALTEVAPEVEAWFGTAMPLGVEGKRTSFSWPATWRSDRYLILPAAEDIGIKRREGRLEIKGRVTDFGPEQFGDRIHGVTERWMKWSHAIGMDSETNENTWLANGPAYAIEFVLAEKRRVLRRFCLDCGAIVEIPSDQMTTGPAVDCELTRIRLNGSPTETHWSIAFGRPLRSRPPPSVLTGCGRLLERMVVGIALRATINVLSRLDVAKGHILACVKDTLGLTRKNVPSDEFSKEGAQHDRAQKRGQVFNQPG